jgi:hypothetical protein
MYDFARLIVAAPTDVRFPHWFASSPMTETIRAAFADRRTAGKLGRRVTFS